MSHQRIRISSRLTASLKLLVPIVTILLFAFCVVNVSSVGLPLVAQIACVVLVGLAVAHVVVGVAPLKNVFIDGDELVVSGVFREERISLRNVSGMRQSRWRCMCPLVMEFSVPCRFGKRIFFQCSFSLRMKRIGSGFGGWLDAAEVLEDIEAKLYPHKSESISVLSTPSQPQQPKPDEPSNPKQ